MVGTKVFAKLSGFLKFLKNKPTALISTAKQTFGRTWDPTLRSFSSLRANAGAEVCRRNDSFITHSMYFNERSLSTRGRSSDATPWISCWRNNVRIYAFLIIRGEICLIFNPTFKRCSLKVRIRQTPSIVFFSLQTYKHTASLHTKSRGTPKTCCLFIVNLPFFSAHTHEIIVRVAGNASIKLIYNFRFSIEILTNPT